MSTESQGLFEVDQEVIFKKGRVHIPGRFPVVKVEPAGDGYLGEIPQLVTIQLPDGPDKFSADYLELAEPIEGHLTPPERRNTVSIPIDKTYPDNSVLCNKCGGDGCKVCDGKGWLTPKSHPDGRRCLNVECNRPLDPTCTTTYCSPKCRRDDGIGLEL